MKQLLLVLASVMCICYTTQSFAQSEIITEDKRIYAEEIIIDNKDNEGLTTIEIKEGKLYIDGNKVSDLDKNTQLKIIKKNTFADRHSFNQESELMDSPFNPRRSYGKIERKALLGVQTSDASPGAEVQSVIKGSAAEKAGIKKGDIIIAVDEKNIASSKELAEMIAAYDKGDEVKIQIERNGKADNLTAQLDAPTEQASPFGNIPGMESFSLPFKDLGNFFDTPGGDFQFFSSSSDKPKLGIEVEEGDQGLEVTKVTENSAAAKAGVQTGDILESIEGNAVSTIEELTTQILSNKNNKKMYLGIQRNGSLKTLPVVLPRAKRRAQF